MFVKSSVRLFLSGVIFIAAVACNAASKPAPSAKPYFEENRGQTDGHVRFLQRGPDYIVFFTADSTVLKVQRRDRKSTRIYQAALRMTWENARPKRILPGGLQPGQVNYLIPDIKSKNITGIRTYDELTYNELYPGVDLVHYSNHGELEHDLRIAPGADPTRIILRFEGADSLALSSDGTLTAKAGPFQFHQLAPVAYQVINGRRKAVVARYALLDNSRVGFQIGNYNHRHQLVIDPVLRYSTFIGGANAIGFDGNPTASTTFVTSMAIDKQGNAYIAGNTTATDYPTTVGAFSRNAGSDCESGLSCASSSGFVTKLNPSGSALVYSTYINSASNGVGIDALAVDAFGNAYITSRNGCADCQETPIVIDKLNAAGSALNYSFSFGGSCGEGFTIGNAIAVNAAGEAYVAGHTSDTCLPTTPNAFETTFPGTCCEIGYIVHIDTSGSTALNATYFGSTTTPSSGAEEDRIADLKLDASGNVYVTGTTNNPSTLPQGASFGQGLTDDRGDVDAGFVAKLDPTLSSLVFSTVLGGALPTGLALDSSNDPYLTGSTRSQGFPTTPGAFQTSFNASNGPFLGTDFPCSHGFVTKLNSSGSALVFSSFLEGSAPDAGTSVDVDSSGNAYVTGVTTSADFPVTRGALLKHYPGGTCNGAPCNAGFVTVMLSSGSGLFSSTYLGGHGDDEPVKIGVDSSQNAYVGGWTSSNNFPITPRSFQQSLSGMSDAFVSKIAFASN
jgi:hypothetical protein